MECQAKSNKRPRLYESGLKSKTHEDPSDAENGQDQDYFKSYADVSVHEEMLSDVVRTNAYRYAILKNYEKVRGKVVADVGAGTGILSLFCVHAGAKKVYAIEASDLAKQTELVVSENKMKDRIDVIQNKVEDVVFPEELDVIVSEWMGYNLFYESMLQSVIHTRDKWLRKGGLMFPEKATLYIAIFCDDDFEDRLEMWEDIKAMYKVSMVSMKDYARNCISQNVHVKCLPPEAVLSRGCSVCSLDLYTVSPRDLREIKCNFEMSSFGHSRIHGFVTWFEVGFPGKTTLTTSPYTEETHWGQTLLYVDKPFQVKQDTRISGTFKLSPNSKKTRFLDIDISYRVGDGALDSKHFYMNDCIT